MSRETAVWLNTNTLIGFTEKRGNAWHYRADLQGDEPNHYAGAVPVADVTRRLFDWTADPRPIFVQVPATFEDATTLDADGAPVRQIEVPGRRAITRSDNGHVMGIFTDGYQVHQFSDWLLGNVSNLLGDTLTIGSAGLLKGGAVAWVSVETPDTLTTREGVSFRPNLLACTSHDGSLSTTYKPVVTNVVCDNTMSAALGEGGATVKVKHSRYSHLRMDEARDALGIVHQVAEDFQNEVRALCQTTVSDRAWSAFLDAHAPIPTDKGRSQTMAQNQQDTLRRLWNHDERVTPWKGTAWGVVQAVNTYTHHEGIVRGADRAERNMLRAVTGGVDKLDASTLETLTKVLATV